MCVLTTREPNAFFWRELWTMISDCSKTLFLSPQGLNDLTLSGDNVWDWGHERHRCSTPQSNPRCQTNLVVTCSFPSMECHTCSVTFGLGTEWRHYSNGFFCKRKEVAAQAISDHVYICQTCKDFAPDSLSLVAWSFGSLNLHRGSGLQV